jgi:prepilin-type N-terminal cleavage/methylation domain-containing protein
MKNYKKAFTLVEVIIVVSVFSVLMITIINIYKGMVSLKYNIQAKQNLLENSYFVMERLNVLLRDYTVDYEEYFNRSAI